MMKSLKNWFTLEGVTLQRFVIYYQTVSSPVILRSLEVLSGYIGFVLYKYL